MISTTRIGIFGGSFDPPHIGHLIIAELARTTMRLDKVIFLPANRPPHKLNRIVTGGKHRFAMTSLAVRGNPAFTVSDFEVRKKGISYTVGTAEETQRRYPRAKLYLIVGADNYKGFHNWRKPQDILAMTELLVYPREKKTTRRASRVHILDAPLISISSSQIRRRVKAGLSIRYLVPDLVHRYIHLHRLYTKKLRRTNK